MSEQPTTQLQDHEGRIGRLEGIVEQMDRRLDSIERRLENIERLLTTQFRWLIGLQIGTILAVASLGFRLLGQ